MNAQTQSAWQVCLCAKKRRRRVDWVPGRRLSSGFHKLIWLRTRGSQREREMKTKKQPVGAERWRTPHLLASDSKIRFQNMISRTRRGLVWHPPLRWSPRSFYTHLRNVSFYKKGNHWASADHPTCVHLTPSSQWPQQTIPVYTTTLLTGPLQVF